MSEAAVYITDRSLSLAPRGSNSRAHERLLKSPREDSETARAVSLRVPRESASLLQPYRFLGYASLEDNGAVEIRDLDGIRRAERLAIRTQFDAA